MAVMGRGEDWFPKYENSQDPENSTEIHLQPVYSIYKFCEALSGNIGVT